MVIAVVGWNDLWLKFFIWMISCSLSSGSRLLLSRRPISLGAPFLARISSPFFFNDSVIRWPWLFHSFFHVFFPFRCSMLVFLVERLVSVSHTVMIFTERWKNWRLSLFPTSWHSWNYGEGVVSSCNLKHLSSSVDLVVVLSNILFSFLKY